MIEVHLIGYTADLRHVVLDLDPDHPRGRYRLEIDLDLFLTLDEVRELRRAAGMEAGPYVTVVDEIPKEGASSAFQGSNAEEESIEGDDGAPDDDDPVGLAEGRQGPSQSVPEAGHSREEPGEPAPDGGHADDTGTHEAAKLGAPGPADEWGEGFSGADWKEGDEHGDGEGGPPQPESRLTPAEIQAMLRAGRSPRTVAKLAGINVRRVERWLPPILAERARVLHEAQATPLGSPSGHSSQTLSAAVKRNLATRGIDAEQVSWTVNRRVDGRWTVLLRYREGNRSRCASWSFNPQEQILTAGSQLAQELGWSGDPCDRREGQLALSRQQSTDGRGEDEDGPLPAVAEGGGRAGQRRAVAEGGGRAGQRRAAAEGGGRAGQRYEPDVVAEAETV